jgi:hypothetical protein
MLIHEDRWTDEHEDANSAFCDYVNVYESPSSTRDLESVFHPQFNLPYFRRRVTVPTFNFKVGLAPPESVC